MFSQEKSVKFYSVNDVIRFAEIASQCEFEIDVIYNHIMLDGKSIISLMSLDLSHPLTVKYEGYNGNFEAFIGSLALSS